MRSMGLRDSAPALAVAAVVALAATSACTQTPAAPAAQAAPAASAPAAAPAPAAAGADAPEPNKHYFVKKGAGKIYPRDLVSTEAKLTAPMTDGRYTYIDEIWNPGFSVEPHFHIEHAEIFYMLDGQIEWTINGETHILNTGDLVFIPPDTVHAVKVVGNKDVHLLMIYEPGGHEVHLEDEQKYTPEQRKQPEIADLLRSHFDFNPGKMPKLTGAAPAEPATVQLSPNSKPVVRPAVREPQPNRYHFIPKGKGPEIYTTGDEVSEVKLTAAMTDGRYSFLDETWKKGMAVPPHFHSAHAETFYVVSGQVEWTIGGETQIVGAGDLVYIPPDTIHTVKVLGDQDVQSLMLYAPGGYEYEWRREAQYTPEQQKDPKIMKELRAQNDFHPVAAAK